MFSSLPVKALRTFESAARLGSFRCAAEELAVTPTAVSHQVRRLERTLGVLLFHRVSRGVRLTPAGERLFRSVHAGLLDMSQTVAELQPGPTLTRLLVTTTHSFAGLWLIPRLGRFRAAHPNATVRIHTSATPVDLTRDATSDLAIRYGPQQEHPDLHVGCRIDETFSVYGAPQVVEQTGDAQPALIAVQWQGSTLYETAWRAWCRAAGLDWTLNDEPEQSFSEEHHALQAAIAGQGLVLASSVMVSESVRLGLLVPYRPDVRVAGASYTALCAPGRDRHPPVRAFLDWLAAEFRTA